MDDSPLAGDIKRFLTAIGIVSLNKSGTPYFQEDVMGKAKIKEGAHLHGCECKRCTMTNITCPECGREYWTEWGDCGYECPRCAVHWDEGRPEYFKLWMQKHPELTALARERGKLRISV